MRTLDLHFLSKVLFKSRVSKTVLDILLFLNLRTFKIEELGYFVVTSKYQMAKFVDSDSQVDKKKIIKALQVLEDVGLIEVVKDEKKAEQVLSVFRGSKGRRPTVIDVSPLVLFKIFLNEVDILMSSKTYRKLGYSLYKTFIELAANHKVSEAVYQTIQKHYHKLENFDNLMALGRRYWFRRKNRSATTTS